MACLVASGWEASSFLLQSSLSATWKSWFPPTWSQAGCCSFSLEAPPSTASATSWFLTSSLAHKSLAPCRWCFQHLKCTSRLFCSHLCSCLSTLASNTSTSTSTSGTSCRRRRLCESRPRKPRQANLSSSAKSPHTKVRTHDSNHWSH